jgi:hypothetical protein
MVKYHNMGDFQVHVEQKKLETKGYLMNDLMCVSSRKRQSLSLGTEVKEWSCPRLEVPFGIGHKEFFLNS